MSVFISDIDTAKLCPTFQTISAVCSFIKVLIDMNKTMSGHWMVAYKSLKTIKENSSWVIPKVVSVAYESFNVTKFKWQLKKGF